MTREELEKAINFRTIDTPCCGNCKWFSREYEDAECKHPLNIWNYPAPETDSENDEVEELFGYHKAHNLLFVHERDACDRFERREAKNV